MTEKKCPSASTVLDDVCDQAQVVFDQLLTGFFVVVLLHFLQQLGFLFRGERLGEAAVRPLHAQDEEKERAAERK